MLFPSVPVDPRQLSRRHAASVPSLATVNTAPSTVAPAGLETSPHARHSTNTRSNSAYSASPLQNPRVSGLAHGSGSTASSPLQGYTNSITNSPSGPQHRLYAASAPSSSTALHRQNSAQGRPPVPLFSQSTGNTPQSNSNSFVSSSSAGSDPGCGRPLSLLSLTRSTSDMSSTDFDFADFAPAMPGAAGNLFGENVDYTSVASFEPINVQQPQTVSPKDIMNDTLSAPNSTTLTDLTTPGTTYDQSPWIANTCDTSPLFSEADLDADASEWPSLFPTSEDLTIKNRSASATSVSQYTATPEKPMTAPKMSRTGSSPGQSSSRSGNTSTIGTRHSFTSGVSSRRRDKPLPAITVDDPNDAVAVKRARNTMAARKSRQKRVERTEHLEATIQDLEQQVEHWKNIAFARGHVE